MSETKTKQRCCKMVHDEGRSVGFHQCSRTAKIERDGKHYCAQHDPEAVKQRDTTQRAKWEKEWAEARAKRKLEKAAPAMLEALKELYAMASRPVASCSNMGHEKSEFHQAGEECPVLAKYRAALAKARAAIKQAEGV